MRMGGDIPYPVGPQRGYSLKLCGPCWGGYYGRGSGGEACRGGGCECPAHADGGGVLSESRALRVLGPRDLDVTSPA
jgi:hypothetical protein